MKLKDRIKKLNHWGRRQVQSKYFAPMLVLIAFSDTFLLVFPVDVLLITAILSHRKSWKLIGFSVFVGNALSAVVFTYLSYNHLEWLMSKAQSAIGGEVINQSQAWFSSYGLFAGFLMAMSPFPIQALILGGALLKVSWLSILAVTFAGRFFKYFGLVYLAMRSPSFAKKYFSK